jgi:eukaryotic-like serine/threonine-protein kinase
MISISEIQAALPAEWQIGTRLNSGGQGDVFDGSYSEVRAAIKVFHTLDTDKRVNREIALLRTINSDRIVKVLAQTNCVVQGVEIELIAYEFLPMGTIEPLLHSTAPLSNSDDLIAIGTDVAEAVEILWSKRVVHRDIKPGNIMLRSTGRYVLVDFGLAKHLDLSNVTQAGASPGTRGYKSPEQAMGRRFLTSSSDVYSLAITLYHVAAKSHPFGGRQPLPGTPMPPLLGKIRPDLSGDLCDLIMKMLQPIPSSRPRDIYARFCNLKEGM